MNDTVYRQATVEDAKGIADVHVSSWQKTYKGIVPEKVLEEMKATIDKKADSWKKQLSETPPSRQVFVAEADDTIIGFVAFGILRDEDEQEGEIYAVYIHPDHLKQKHGKTLFKIAEQKLVEDGYKKAYVSVLKDNMNAREFYTSVNENVKVTKEFTTDIGGKILDQIQYCWDLKISKGA